MGGLIVASEALAAGTVTPQMLRKDYAKVFQNVHRRRDAELTAALRAEAAFLWSGRKGVVSGVSAAALHGNPWISADRPAELVRQRHDAPSGIVIHNDRLLPAELMTVRGIPVTTPARTVFDVGRRVRVNRAIELVDVLLRLCTVESVTRVAERHRGVRGLRQLERVLALADAGAESVQETRLRLCLVTGGLPEPETQIELRGPDGRIIRLDMGWREQRVAAEFDGAQHWGDSTQHRRDIERQETIASLGWRLVRVSRDQLMNQQKTVIERVRAAFSAAQRAA
ncbi:DUF559 domain-containing protein [Mycobacteroides franklinii]|uniref:DUF559 domain-containing protein n=1 Tax=Mycobacteroides franklinii TaxID=948102 RepID=A0A4R5P7U4_9MYCO|nr:DUF559 domain-containing protein [Mycobacteroides franklinii]ORA58107.1 hypothetical protein BST24_23040 [Mycobacteroides franklinii]TDH19564.1 DUF559 domain-containing protein [Mycobacteroides franklinii]